MIHILVGDDRHHIEKEINKYKQQIPQHLQALNYQRYSSDRLSEAIIDALSVSFSNYQKVVVIENCNFREFGEPGLSLLQPITKLPESTCLIFTASSIDRRLKVSKFLLDLGKITEYQQIPPWRSDLLVKAVETEAREMGLRLTKDASRYLADAIGTNSEHREKELEKLAVYADGHKLNMSQVTQLVPVNTQTSLQLADAIKSGRALLVAGLTNELLAKGEPPLKIIATLITQFRTWLWTKLAIIKGIRSNAEIARLANVGNVNRIYYLRQEVAKCSLKSLSQTVVLLFELQVACQQGMKGDAIRSRLLIACRAFH
ncbi:DNA polymerase III subunit delta [Pleurocapsales cyanobacterium LEGE 10410]|nr:DNA polymerase III subunit delta [Pleurocapsales cyanobacterium LEGE 10410]